MTLYVPPGFVYTQYNTAVNEMVNSDNPWWARGVFGVLAVLSAPLAAAEELTRSVENVPFTVENAGIGIGEHAARAELWAEQDEYGEATVEGLHAVSDFSTGFVAAGSVAAPVGAALESRLAEASELEVASQAPGATVATSWQQHEQLVTQQLVADNPGVNIGRQVTLDVTGPTGETVRIRIDDLVPTNGRYQLVDAKFSSVTDLTNPATDLTNTVTDNQSVVYDWVARGEQVTVVPEGANAEAAGLTPGVPIQVQPSVQIHVNGPNGIVVRNY